MKRWYVAQVYAGYEDSVKEDLSRRIAEGDLKDSFGEIMIPSAKMRKFFEAGEPEDEHLFPGYMLIEMEVAPETMRLVLSNPRIMRFLGGKDPVPLSSKEVDRIKSQVKGEVVVSTTRESGFTVGSEVDIREGAFAGFVGVIDRVDEENERLTVMVSIFGRMTPVELSFDQVKR
jgi:transcriptional antiterminator NusG